MYILDAAGAWDEECVRLLAETVRTDVAAFDALLMLVLGPDCYSSPKLFMDKEMLSLLLTERVKLTRTPKRTTERTTERAADRLELEAAFEKTINSARSHLSLHDEAPQTSAWTDVAPLLGED